MSRAYFMPLHVAEYLGDTGHLSTLQHGAYMLLIMHYWQTKELPKSDDELARIARLDLSQWAAVRPVLVNLFDKNWRHKRVELELRKAQALMKKRAEAGREGAKSRWSDNDENPNKTGGENSKRMRLPSVCQWQNDANGMAYNNNNNSKTLTSRTRSNSETKSERLKSASPLGTGGAKNETDHASKGASDDQRPKRNGRNYSAAKVHRVQDRALAKFRRRNEPTAE